MIIMMLLLMWPCVVIALPLTAAVVHSSDGQLLTLGMLCPAFRLWSIRSVEDNSRPTVASRNKSSEIALFNAF